MQRDSAISDAGPTYTVTELSEILGIAKYSVRRKTDAEAWPYTEEEGNGGKYRTFRLFDTPDYIQRTLLLYEAKRRREEAEEQAREEAAQPGTALAEASGQPGRALPEALAATGKLRYLVLRRWMERREAALAKGQTVKAAGAKFVKDFAAGRVSRDALDALGEVSLRTILHWDKQFRDAGQDWKALCDMRGRGGPARTPGCTMLPEAREIFLGFYLTENRPSIALAYRAMSAALAKRGLPSPSRRTVERFAAHYRANHLDHVVLSREGEKALADKVGPYITRDTSQLAVGDVLFADGHDLNFDSINPLTGRPARLTLIVWFDWASRMPVGWEVMPTETTVAIAAALRMAIRNLGKIPKVAYIDNGRAFRAKYFKGVSEADWDAQTTGLYGRLGIEVQHSRPYQARTKIVERFFRTFGEQCARLLPSFRGASIADKPAYLARNEKFHQARHNDWVPTIQETVQIFADYVGWYSQQPHRGLDGARPVDVFAAGRGPGVDLASLDWEFMWRKEVKASRCRVRLNGIDYEADELFALDQAITAYYDWADLTQVRVHTADGAYLCTARAVAALPPVARALESGEASLEQVKEANRRAARLKKRTLQLARETGAPDEAVAALPWMQQPRERKLLALPEPARSREPEAPATLSAADLKEIEEARAAWEARKNAAPPYERPRFANEYDRYDHLFDLKMFQKIQLLPEDTAFMAAYEASREYPVVRRRFDQLRRLAEMETRQEAGV